MGHQKVPDLPLGVGEFSRRTWVAVHQLLYVLMVAVPIVGIVARVWHGRPFDYGIFQLNFGVASNSVVFDPAEQIHQLLAYALLALASLHIAGALYHHFIRRDGVLLRMMPGDARFRPQATTRREPSIRSIYPKRWPFSACRKPR